MTTTETNPLVAAALLYGALGWPVVPLFTPVDGVCDCPQSYKDNKKCKPGKHPRTRNGLDDASCDEAQILRWWKMFPTANIGVDLARSGLVDIAPDSIDWFAEFTARGLPPTLKFASGGGEGHAHHLYRRPEDCATYRDAHSGEYDILSNGYAVMPPSMHASGRSYTWLDPVGGVILSGPGTSAPRWAVDVLNSKGRRREAPPETGYDADAPPVDLRGDALERWYGRLYEVSKDHGGVDRSYSLWWLAVVLLEAGLTRLFVEDLIAERDKALGWTKFTNRTDAHARYRIIVAHAYAGMGPRRTPRPPDQERPRSSAPPTIEWLTAARLAEVEDEEIRWYAHGLVGAGLITELDGKAKQAGKTTLVLALAHAILHNEEFLGQSVGYTPIVYLAEQSGPSFKRNLSRAGLLDREDLHILLWNRVVGMKWADIVMAARARAKEVGAGLLIVDTLAQFSGIRGDDENKSGAAMDTMEPVQAATTDDLAVLVSRHDRKSGGEVGDSGRGSSAYAGAVDIVLHLQRLPPGETGKERQRLLDGISRFEETPDKLLIELVPGEEGEHSWFRAIGDQAEVRRETLGVEILETLPSDPDIAMTGPDLRELLGVAANELMRALWELMKAHLIVRIGEGKRGSAFRYVRRAPQDMPDE